jgi:glycosyltransferase involved in cell wall biosynthesis
MNVEHIIYVHYWPIPMLAANTVHVMKMCQGYRRNGLTVTLFAPRPNIPPSIEDIWQQYGITTHFSLRLLKTRLKRHDLFVRAAWFARQQTAPLLHTRSPAAAFYAVKLRVPVVLEVHGPAAGGLSGNLLPQLLRSPYFKRLIVITEPLRSLYLKQFAPTLSPHKIQVEADAVDMRQFHDETQLDHAAAILRDQYGYAQDAFIALYAGSLYQGRGVDFIIALAQALPQMNFIIVGGTTDDVTHWTTQLATPANLRFIVAVPNADLPAHLRMADTLLMPYARQVLTRNAGIDTSAYCSPMKMFEYMAVHRPIVTSDLPVLHEVLHEQNALFCTPEALQEWQRALRLLHDNPRYRNQLATRAVADVQYHTWERRAHRILTSLKQDADDT